MTVARNDLCPCGSGKKFKKCCLRSSGRIYPQVRNFLISPSRQRVVFWVLISLLLLSGVAAYLNSFQGVFVFDDKGRILGNENIQTLSFPWKFLGKTRRPILYLTLAVNYALGGYKTFGYHLVNLLIHLIAGLALFGIIRRTCLTDRVSERMKKDALLMAFTVSLLWLVHPLQTQSVTYLIQRAESLMGMFYLLTLYTSIRFMTSHKFKWALLAWGACLMGGLTKEVMITAPLVVLLYDRAFISKRFQKVWAEHKMLYAGLFLTPLIMILNLFIIPPEKNPSMGFSKGGFFSPGRLLDQPSVILHYLKLSFFPYSLVLDYGFPPSPPLWIIILSGLLVMGMFGGCILAYKRYPAVGFLGLSFFLILAPTSSFIPLNMIFDHRMYLPLAVVITLSVLGIRKWFEIKGSLPDNGKFITGVLFISVAFISIGLTIRRNQDFRSEIRIWADNVKKLPRNPRALNNYGLALIGAGQDPSAEVFIKKALELKPDYFEAHNNLGLALLRQGKFEEAAKHCEEAIKLKPDYVEAYCNFGLIFVHRGDLEKAIEKYKQALRVDSGYTPALNNIGVALEQKKQYKQALGYYQRAVRLKPDYAQAVNNVGVIYFKWGQWAKAKGYFEKAIQLDPRYDKARQNLYYCDRELEKEVIRKRKRSQ